MVGTVGRALGGSSISMEVESTDPVESMGYSASTAETNWLLLLLIAFSRDPMSFVIALAAFKFIMRLISFLRRLCFFTDFGFYFTPGTST